MLFAFYCKDRANALEVRLANRPAHLDWLNSHSGIQAAGPLLGQDMKPCGSLLIVEHPDLAAAKSWSSEDPYAQAGLFDTVEIMPWTKVI